MQPNGIKRVMINLLKELNRAWESKGAAAKHSGDGYVAQVYGSDRSLPDSRAVGMLPLPRYETTRQVSPGLYLDCTRSLDRYTLFRLTPGGNIHLITVITGGKAWWVSLLAEIEIALRIDNRDVLRARLDVLAEQMAELTREISRLDEEFGEKDKDYAADQTGPAAGTQHSVDVGAQA